MLVIRLSRIGRKNKPFFRVILQEKTKAPGSKALETLGSYNPHTDPATFEVDAERVKHWLSVGAEPSATVHNFLVDKKIIPGPKLVITRAKRKPEEAVKQ